MKLYSDKNIINSWLQNAKPWISAIRNNEIESRSLITNKAIKDTILEKKPIKVLDIGCGEGWLARELNSVGVDVCGIDIVPQLIDEANKQGHGKFLVLPYEDLSQETIKEKYDVAVCNFSLLGNESVAKIFQSISGLLNENGYFIVQTIHPISGCGDEEYIDGWRKGTWKGFSDSFTNPPPWYFRTLETWKDLFLNNGFSISEITEPLNPKTKSFASIIFVGKIEININN
ncbi:MAG: 2-polyprenyl-3-methyl-5-hydroxy-6-metoxy-1,4-benzoquinol methylase [Roseivirga sp.]|jgi:2-polyprenyl-3-methyl-5-hydroxy-6-metoxy-1,4-benzoquinol methylase